MYKIIKKISLNDTVCMMVIKAPFAANKAKAGQFVIIRANETGERIPLTIADHNKEDETITIIFQTVGKSTKILSEIEEGESISDLAGPLGTPTHTGDAKKVCIIGGGVGNAIAYPQAKSLFEQNAQVDVIAGFRSKDFVILENEMKAVCQNLYITTDDGTYGDKGFVTDKLKHLVQNGADYDLVIAIGPVPMMKFVCQLTKELNIKTIVSLNPIMIDGTGMCGCCRVRIGSEVKFACVDGPDFDGHLVDFDELMLRNNAYKSLETQKRCSDCNLLKE